MLYFFHWTDLESNFHCAICWTVNHSILKNIEENLLVVSGVTHKFSLFERLIFVIDLNLYFFTSRLQLNDVLDLLCGFFKSEVSKTLLKLFFARVYFKKVFALEKTHFRCN